MLCYRCGSHVKDGSEKCWNCGAQLAGAAKGGIPSLDELRERQKTRSRMSGVVYKVGDVVGGRYKVLDILGTGGAGVVYRAHDQEIDVDVAVKVINAKLVQTAEEKRLFSREIKIARKLSHQNIVRIFDEGTDGDRVFATMQYLDGLPLRKIIDLRRSKDQYFGLGEIEPLLNQLCQALDYAHKSGYHGNLKPDNIVILPDLLKITDFGILKGLPRKPFLAIQKSRKVNFNYYAPEIRLEVRDLNQQVDIYSLGVILWEMLTGDVYEDTKSDALKADGVDANVVRVIKRCLSRSPKERYKTAGALYNAFREVMETSGISSAEMAESYSANSADDSRTGPPPPPESSTVTPSKKPQPAGKVPEGTGQYEAIDDEMIEDSAIGGQSEELVASELEIPPLADAASSIEAKSAKEEPEELNASDIELISDPKATNIVEISPEMEEVRRGADPEIIGMDDEEGVATASSTDSVDEEGSDYAEDEDDEATEAWIGEVPAGVIETGSEDSTGDEKPNDPTKNPSDLRPTEGPTEAANVSSFVGKDEPQSDSEEQPNNVTEDLQEMANEKTPYTGKRPAMAPRVPNRSKSAPRMPAPVRKAKARPATRPRMAAMKNPPVGFDGGISSGSIPAPPMPPAVPPAAKNNTALYLGGGILLLFALLTFFQWQQNQKHIERLTSTIEQLSKRENVALKTVEDEEQKAETARLEVEKAAKAEAEAQAAAQVEAERRAKAEAEAKAAAEAEAKARNRGAAEAARKLKVEKQREADEAARAEIAAREREKAEAQRKEEQEAARKRAEARKKREGDAAKRLAEERRRLQEERKSKLDDERAERAEARRRKAEEARAAAKERRRANEEARRRAKERKEEEAARRAEEKKAAAAAVVSADPKCPRGMAMVKAGTFRQGSAANDPERNFGDLSVKRVDLPAFCVDYYEYPNGKNRTPTARVSYKTAVKRCARRGKRLCTEPEWEKACAGPRNIRYPYGNAWNAEKCVTEDEDGNDRTVQKSGKFKTCRSGYGTIDMGGNVAEWTSTAWGSGMVVKGGAADRPGYDSRCAARKKKKKKYSSEMLGFRCCANPK